MGLPAKIVLAIGGLAVVIGTAPIAAYRADIRLIREHELALRHPERVTALVPLNPLGCIAAGDDFRRPRTGARVLHKKPVGGALPLLMSIICWLVYALCGKP